MPFIRRRGNPTSLVEAYRDAAGRRRQRVLANLRGTSSPLDALAKLAGLRERFRKEKDVLSTLKDADEFYERLTTVTSEGRRFSKAERKEIDGLLRGREKLLRRQHRIETDIARTQKDGAVVKKHCDASANEIQAAIRRYKNDLENAEAAALGSEYFHKEAKRELRRLAR